MLDMDSCTVAQVEDEKFERIERILYDYFAFVMLEPIPTEGFRYLIELDSMTTGVIEVITDKKFLVSIEQMRYWITEALNSNDPASAQRELAVDRTYLFRGVDEKGPLPPYEGFYSTEERPTIAAIDEIYRNAGVRPSNKERIDYLGQELAFVSVLEQKRVDILEQGGLHTEELDEMLDGFISEHLSSWVGSYCRSALPYTRTDYFKGFLTCLDLWIGHR